MENKKNYPILLLWSFIAALSVVLIVINISFFYLNYEGNDGNTKNIRINSGFLATDFSTSQYINNTSGTLLNPDQVATEADYTAFNVSYTEGSVTTAKYNVSLTKINISDNLISPYFKWSLLLDNKEIAQGAFDNYDNSGEIILNKNNLELAAGQKSNLVLRVWLENDETVNQESLLNGYFQAKVAINVAAES